MPKQSGIYCIENTVNGKKYIGMAQDIAGRWRSHKCELKNNVHGNSYLQHAWNKYGEQSFKFYVLENVSKKDLPSAEIKWISRLGTFGNGYNLTAGGEGQYKRNLTDEQKAHLSEINMGAKNPNFGLKRSEETRKKMSEAMKGIKRSKLSKAHKEAISRKIKGKPHPWFNKPILWVETGKIFKSISEAAEKTGYSISGISCVCRKKRNSIYKQHFVFIGD